MQPTGALIFSAALLLVSFGTASPTPTKADVAAAIRKAQASDAGIRDYLAVLPKDGDYYVTEGDILRTEEEIRENFEQLRAGKQPVSSKELTVNRLPSGALDIWAPGQRQLRYSIDHRSFASQAAARDALIRMELAAAEWERLCGEACGVTFRFKDDPTPSPVESTFVIREVDSGGRYVAAAFFPSYSAERRFLNIDRSFHKLSAGLRQGVLRHELGHVLGYRHEHIHGVPGCFSEGGLWKQVTEYDPISVMHYHCGGGGTPELVLSELDKAGHIKTYGR